MNSFVNTLKQLGPSRLGIMGAILAGLMLFFIFVSMRISSPDMGLLFSDLSGTDSGAMAAKLEESNIPYEVSKDGSKITVPEKDVGRARLLLAAAGLPNGGSMGYEIFDEGSGFGTTNFIQNINQVRALEGELARTIGAVQGVKSARVHLVLPQRELFSRESRPSSASVFLNTGGRSNIEQEQILAIQSLVASAVPGLKTSSVAIIDSTGQLLAQGSAESDEVSLMTMKSAEMRRSYETRLEQKIEDQIGRIVGYGKVRATVTAEINFDQINQNEELYDPEGQVVRSSQTTNESNSEREAQGQSVSVENNLPSGGLINSGSDQPTAQGNKTEEVTNYEISKTVRSTMREVGEIKRLSVAVLVDGQYVAPPPPAEGAADAEKKDEEAAPEKVYQPRTQEELDRLTALVKSAVGYDQDRGDTLEVVNMQFAAVDTNEESIDERQIFGFEKNKLLDMAEIVMIAIMVLLVVMLVLQPMVNRLLAVDSPEIDEQLEADLLAPKVNNPALAAPSEFAAEGDAVREDSLINIQGVDGKVKASTIKKVEEIVQNYPNETVSVIRSWMTQETT